jgi:hypothetical protein
MSSSVTSVGTPFLLLKIEIRAEEPTAKAVENGDGSMSGGLARQSGL